MYLFVFGVDELEGSKRHVYVPDEGFGSNLIVEHNGRLTSRVMHTVNVRITIIIVQESRTTVQELRCRVLES
jgi:hypothetical protein